MRRCFVRKSEAQGCSMGIEGAEHCVWGLEGKIKVTKQ